LEGLVHYKLFVVLILFAFATNIYSQSKETLLKNFSSKDTLVVLWTSEDPAVAEKVCLMYTHAAAKYDWFKNITLIVWGPSANLLANNKKLQEKIKRMDSDGIHLQACIVCADSYGVSDKLREMGIEVIGMGKPLTQYLKKDYSILTF
jgi:hypothetical protein